MEGSLDPVKTPLLSTEGEKAKQDGGAGGRDLVNALKRDFFSQLPEKIKSQLDPETPFELDLSRANGLIEGISGSPFYFSFLNHQIYAYRIIINYCL